MLRSRKKARAPRWPAGLGAVLLAIATAGVAYPLWWEHHSSTVGLALVRRALDASAGRGNRQLRVECPSSGNSAVIRATAQRPGLLEIPAIGLTAPVLDGLTEAVLDVAIGHDPATVWPGSRGESLLLAHDVSYFSGLARLRAGDSVIWEIGCERMTFRVTAARITVPGAVVPVPPSDLGLALITCWPTDALFWTSDRYVVQTELVSQEGLDHPEVGHPAPLATPLVPAPRALAAEGLALGQSGVIAGHLTLTGSPTAAIRFGPEPLAIADAAFRDYAAAAKTAASGNRSWWSAIALRGVPLPRPWSLAYYTDVTVEFRKDVIEAVELKSRAITVTLSVRHDVLFVANVRR